MTTDLIAQAEAVMDGVTPGEWTAEGPDHSIIVWSDDAHRVCFMTSDGNPTVNARFIAWCRTGVPALIARIRELEGANRELALDVLAASGQAQEAYEAQLAAEAKLVEVEKERDRWEAAAQNHARWQIAAEATVATLTAQVERYCYVLEGVRNAINTGRSEPLFIWRGQINIALDDAAYRGGAK